MGESDSANDVVQENESAKIARLEWESQELRAEVERLRRVLEETLQAGKRQAAPFSRRSPKANPENPGRKAGPDYGRRCRREIPDTVN